MPTQADSRRNHDWSRDTEAVGSALRGFQEIALLKALKNARGRDRVQIRKEYFAAATKGGAKFFMHKVALMAHANRTSIARLRERSVLSLFRSPPVRRWVPDPITIYRRRSASQDEIPRR